MISVEQAMEALLALVSPVADEDVPLIEAAGRYLGRAIAAKTDQPPFAASAMDGYAVADGVGPGDRLRVIAEAAAGHGFNGALCAGEAVRIFTGARVPQGARRILIQEDVERLEGDRILVGPNPDLGPYIRPQGMDFQTGDTLSPRWLGATDLALAAAMGHGHLTLARRAQVAVIATGDELVPAGTPPGPDQIVASNIYGLHALFEACGARVQLFPIVPDTSASLTAAFEKAAGADLIVTVGGASVGEYDLIGQVSASLGMERSFYKVAVRPGKPLIAGKLGSAAVVGLPGNPVSALVCGKVFVEPMLRRMQGDPNPIPVPERAPLAHAVPANGPRAHYMRAELKSGRIQVAERQESSLLSVMARANVLAIRPPFAEAKEAGDEVDFLRL